MLYRVESHDQHPRNIAIHPLGPELFRPSAGIALSEVHREVGHGGGLELAENGWLSVWNFPDKGFKGLLLRS